MPDDELMMITRHGIIIRLPVDGIRVIGRNTQGVKVMNLDAGRRGGGRGAGGEGRRRRRGGRCRR